MPSDELKHRYLVIRFDVTVNSFDRFDQVPSHVLEIASFLEAFGPCGFDAQENSGKDGGAHHRHQLFIARDVHVDFGKEHEGVAARFLPGGQLGQQPLVGAILVADEVVVDNKELIAPSSCIECVKLGEKRYQNVMHGSRRQPHEAATATISITPKFLKRTGVKRSLCANGQLT